MAKLRNRGEFEHLTWQRAGGGRVPDTLLVYTVTWGHPGGALTGNQTCGSLTHKEGLTLKVQTSESPACLRQSETQDKRRICRAKQG